MRFKGLFISVLALVALAACSFIEERTIRGSGDIETTVEEFSGFDRLDVSHTFDVEVNQGESFRVVIRTDDNVVEYLDVRKSGNTLVLGLEPDLLSLNNVTLEAEVTMPELSKVDLSGASSLDLQGFSSSEDFEADISGASRLTGELEAGNVNIGVSGASKVRLSGSGDDLTAHASGASELELADFEVGDAVVDASGASTVEVWASGVLDAEASGASDIIYFGNPESVREDTSGASSVKSG